MPIRSAGKLATLILSALPLFATSDDPGAIPTPPPAFDVPEPATWQMLALAGAAGLTARTWARRKRR